MEIVNAETFLPHRVSNTRKVQLSAFMVTPEIRLGLASAYQFTRQLSGECCGQFPPRYLIPALNFPLTTCPQFMTRPCPAFYASCDAGSVAWNQPIFLNKNLSSNRTTINDAPINGKNTANTTIAIKKPLPTEFECFAWGTPSVPTGRRLHHSSIGTYRGENRLNFLEPVTLEIIDRVLDISLGNSDL